MKVSIADEIFTGRENYLFSGGGMIIGVLTEAIRSFSITKLTT